MVAQIEKTLLFLLTLSVLIVLHELGHFILARRNGVRVNEFAMGFGPKLLKWTSKRSGTTYALNLFPIGGYCAMQGEDGKSSEAEQQRKAQAEGLTHYEQDNFQAKSVWQRLAIIVAGPAANFLLAFVILFVAAFFFGVADLKAQQSIVGPLTQGYPAQKSGLQTGDRLIAINGKSAAGGKQFVDIIHASRGKTLALTYSHDGRVRTIPITPIRCPAETGHPEQGCIGFAPIPVFQRAGFGEAMSTAAFGVVDLTRQTATRILLMIRHPRQYAGSVTGPIGISRAAAVVQDFGWAPYLNLAAIISLSLGFFNLLPIPALDGGRAAFIVAELLRGKPVAPEKEALVHFAGFAVLMLLMIAVAYHDVANIVAGKGVF